MKHETFNTSISHLRLLGFTLVEAVMSILIVGLMLVAALNTVGASKVARARNAEQAIGPMLAQDLMSEVLSQYYQEPDDSIVFGLELNEIGSSRAAYDDVDDYHGWSAKPPRAKDNSVLPDLASWSRHVTVARADTSDPNNNSLTETGLKRIAVTVKHQGRTVYTLTALRTDGWPEEAPEAGDDGGGLLGGVLNLLF